ncbi:MAG: SGNH/GDSL hydrolase family protein [Chloroflexota bacterium]
MAVIVCFGDSNTHGYEAATSSRYPKGVRWPGVLAAGLGPDHEVIEEGLNGRTTIWEDPFLEGRNGRAHLLPCLRTHAPVDLLVLMLGTNDTKTIFGRTAPEIASGVDSLVDLALRSATGPGGSAPQVLIVAPPAPGEVTERSELWGFGEARAKGLRMAGLYRRVATHRKVAFLDAGEHVTVDPADGVHLLPDAHAALGRAVAAAVRGLV